MKILVVKVYLITVNPFYKDIRFNSKFRYNVNLVWTENKRIFIFSLTVPSYSLRGDSNKYKTIRYLCFRRVQIKLLSDSQFDFTAKSLVTNTVALMWVLCIARPVNGRA